MTDDYDVFKDRIGREDFESRIKAKIKEFQGLLTRQGAISIIASELGIDLNERPTDISIRISDIIEGTTNVDIVGKILRKSEPKEFMRKTTDTRGQVLRLEIGDETGTIPVVLWDEKVCEAQPFSPGDVIKIRGGFAKCGLNGRLELTVQRRGGIEACSDTVDIEERRSERVEIASLEEGMANVNLLGVVVNVSDIREYEREGRSFKVCTLHLKDSSGQVKISLWNNNADKSLEMSIGDAIGIDNCYVRYGFGGIEVQTNSYTAIDLTPITEGISLPSIDTEVAISDITPDMQFFTITGTVYKVYDPRSFEREDGSQGHVTSIELQDESGICRVSLWDDKAKVAQSLPVGTSIMIEGCKAREGLDGVEVSVGASGRLMPRMPDIGAYTARPSGIARVMEIKDGAIKAASREGSLLLMTEERGFRAGDLIAYEGALEGEGIAVRSIKPSSDDYPSLEELTDPPYRGLSELVPEELVRVRGLVRQATPMRDVWILRLDDGSGLVTGYCGAEVDAGSEYDIVARTFANGDGVEFFGQSVESADMANEAYRLLELF